MSKRHGRRWKADEPVPAPGKRAAEGRDGGKSGILAMKPDTTEPKK
jgi:hypothetical protein